MHMTEEEWQDSTDPAAMLKLAGDRASDRKLRLFACACCRRIWLLLPDDDCRDAVEIAEAFAEGLIDVEAVRSAEGAGYVYDDSPHEAVGGAIFQLCQVPIHSDIVASATSIAVSRSILGAEDDLRQAYI